MEREAYPARIYEVDDMCHVLLFSSRVAVHASDNVLCINAQQLGHRRRGRITIRRAVQWPFEMLRNDEGVLWERVTLGTHAIDQKSVESLNHICIVHLVPTEVDERHVVIRLRQLPNCLAEIARLAVLSLCIFKYAGHKPELAKETMFTLARGVNVRLRKVTNREAVVQSLD
jgi:hypothetical protein